MAVWLRTLAGHANLPAAMTHAISNSISDTFTIFTSFAWVSAVIHATQFSSLGFARQKCQKTVARAGMDQGEPLLLVLGRSVGNQNCESYMGTRDRFY